MCLKHVSSPRSHVTKSESLTSVGRVYGSWFPRVRGVVYPFLRCRLGRVCSPGRCVEVWESWNTVLLMTAHCPEVRTPTMAHVHCTTFLAPSVDPRLRSLYTKNKSYRKTKQTKLNTPKKWWVPAFFLLSYLFHFDVLSLTRWRSFDEILFVLPSGRFTGNTVINWFVQTLWDRILLPVGDYQTRTTTCLVFSWSVTTLLNIRDLSPSFTNVVEVNVYLSFWFPS